MAASNEFVPDVQSKLDHASGRATVRIIVLDGHTNQALACVRSLSSGGHRVILGSSQPSWTAGWSRYCHEKFVYPPPESDAEGFIGYLRRRAMDLDGALILPMIDRTTLQVSRHRDVLDAVGGVTVLPPHETVLAALDKSKMIMLAQSLSIDVPETVVMESSTNIDTLLPTLRYPVVLKPRMTEELKWNGTTKTTGIPLYAQNEADFLWAISKVRLRSTSILIQEFVEGRGVGYFALMNQGQQRAEFAHERIREVRASGSGSALRQSVQALPRVREAALALLRNLGWHGVAMVEFRLRDNGTPVFMEVNGRFWNSLALAIHAGIDFPMLLAQLAETGDVPTSPAYREGIKCRWLLGDFRHVVDVWRGRPRGYPNRYPPRIPTLYQFLVPTLGTFHDSFRWDDPLPEVGDWLHFIARKVPETLRPFRTGLRNAHAQRRDAHP